MILQPHMSTTILTKVCLLLLTFIKTSLALLRRTNRKEVERMEGRESEREEEVEREEERDYYYLNILFSTSYKIFIIHHTCNIYTIEVQEVNVQYNFKHKDYTYITFCNSSARNTLSNVNSVSMSFTADVHSKCIVAYLHS